MAQADREYRRAWGGALYIWAALLLGLASIFGLFAMVYGLSPGIQPPPEVDKLPSVICLLFFATLSAVPGHLDRISVYVPPEIGIGLLEEIRARGADEVWFNPGSADDELLARAERLGLEIIQACSIVDVGMSPGDLP